MRIAVVADDLTGALDVCAPMAARGLSCQIALDPSGLEAAMVTGADVVCVNTSTRELAHDAAVAIVRLAADQLAAHKPTIAFKKVDSRLKGHVSAETSACLAAFGRPSIVVAPAIPSQKRYVKNGAIVGFGVATPIRIADVFGFHTRVPDSLTQADLNRVATEDAAKTLFVGASGLGEGFATLMGQASPAPMVRPQMPTIIALGSHDPITLEQARSLIMEAALNVDFSRDGILQATNETRSITLLQATSSPGSSGYASRMERFGEIVAAKLRTNSYASALLCGGQTAQTVVSYLGATYARLVGSAAMGIPLLRMRVGHGYLTLLTKSGGFGTPDMLATLFGSGGAGAFHVDINAGEQ